MTRYWTRVVFGLALAAAGIIGVDWSIYHLVRTGSCGSSGTYISSRPCPPGTGGHILALLGGIFGSLIGTAVYMSRGQRGQPARIGLGVIMWSLLFLTLAGSVALSAYGPANNHNPGARTAAIILGVIFVPMGLAPLLPLAFGGRKRQAQASREGSIGMTFAPAPRFVPAVRAVPAAGEEDPLDRIAKLGELRDRGLVTPEEFEEQKKRLLGEL